MDFDNQLPQISSGQAQKEVRMNALVDALSPAALYGRDADNCTGLDFAYFGGRFLSNEIAADVITVTDDATTYVVAARADGTVSASTSNTNWNDDDDYVRLWQLVAADGAIEEWYDHRQAIGASGGGGSGTPPPKVIQVACSDEASALTTGTNKVKFRAPYAMTLNAGNAGVRCSLSTAQTSGSTFTVDVNVNGSTILSTKLTVDNGETTSLTAASNVVLSSTAIADDDEIEIDIDQIGDGTAKGLKVTLIGT